MAKTETDTSKNLLSRIFGSFVRSGDYAPENGGVEPAHDTGNLETAIEKSVAGINALYDRKAKLLGVRAAELRKKETIEQQLQKLDAQRVQFLTEHRISGGEQDKQRAAELLEQIERLKREMADIAAIVDAIEQKVADLNGEIVTAERGYRINLGKFLDTQMDGLVAVYNEMAPEFARIVTDIEALYRTMMKYQCGNTNGWWRDARIPTIKPREGHIYPPILDTTSKEFDIAGSRRALELIAAFREGGYFSQFDK